MKRSVTILISAGAGLALLAAGTTAGAAIAGGPIDGTGVIYGCYTTTPVNGLLAIHLVTAGAACPAGMTAIKWNQQGPAGPAGAPGLKGDTGPAGPQGQAGPAGAAGAMGPPGPPGAQGAPGPQGPQGNPGPAGADGNTVLNGAGPPGNLGHDGDFYLDTAGDVLYGPKAGGAWPATGVSLLGSPGATGPAGPQGLAGPQGPAGADGSTVLNGTGAPQAAVGNDGDFYIDTAADVLYGPKANGSWPAVGTSLTGAPGTGATVAPLAAGDTHCANGGAAITDGSGNTAYACTGGTGPPGPALSSDTDFNGITCTTNGGAAGTIAIQPASPSTGPDSGNLITLKCVASPTDANCTHSNGEGQTYTDCNDLLGDPATGSGYTQSMAGMAANVYPGGTLDGIVTTDCSGVNGSAAKVFISQSGTIQQVLLWQYSGPNAGHVHAQAFNTALTVPYQCATSSDPTWN